MRAISLLGESLSADASAVDGFISKLLSKMEQEGYTLSQMKLDHVSCVA